MNDNDVVNEITRAPYASWLEEGLRTLAPLRPSKLCLCAILPDGNVFTGYFECSATDKAVISHNIYTDCLLDTLRNNGVVFDDGEDGEDE